MLLGAQARARVGWSLQSMRVTQQATASCSRVIAFPSHEGWAEWRRPRCLTSWVGGSHPVALAHLPRASAHVRRRTTRSCELASLPCSLMGVFFPPLPAASMTRIFFPPSVCALSEQRSGQAQAKRRALHELRHHGSKAADAKLRLPHQPEERSKRGKDPL